MSEVEEYLEQVRQEADSTFAEGYVSANTKAPKSVLTSSSLLANFFSSIRGASLEKNLLPNDHFVEETLSQFTKCRQDLLTRRSVLQSLIPQARKRHRGGTRTEMLESIVGLSSLVLPETTEAKEWARWVRRTVVERETKAFVSTLLAFEEKQCTALFHALVAQLFGSEEYESEAEYDGEPCTEERSETSDVASDVIGNASVPKAVADALTFIGKLSNRHSLGAWLYAALICLDVPLTPSTEIEMQRLLQQCCVSIRTVASFKNIAPDCRLATRLLTQTTQTIETCADVSVEDVSGVYTILVILAKFYRQGNPSLLPL
jgi:hypothetical protein